MADIITKTCRAIVKRGSEKPPHGGKRPGAGRPPKAEGTSKKSDLRSIRIPDDEWEIIKTVAAASGVTTSAFIRNAAYDAAVPKDLFPREIGPIITDPNELPF